ncbi:MAG: hypothetical protein AAF367_16605 [Pseudomonadota bacterium]
MNEFVALRKGLQTASLSLLTALTTQGLALTAVVAGALFLM